MENQIQEEQPQENINQDYNNVQIVPEIPISAQAVEQYIRISKEFQILMRDYENQPLGQNGEKNDAYILSTKFLKRWKVLVSYQEAIQDQPLSKFAGGPKIFEQINQDLVVNNNEPQKLQDLIKKQKWSDKYYTSFFNHHYEYRNDSVDQTHLNVIMKDNLQEGADFIYIDQEIWDFFVKQYEGIPIRRVAFKNGEEKKIEVYPLKFNILFVNHELFKKIDMQKYPDFDQKYFIQLTKYMTIKQMYNYFENYLRKYERMGQNTDLKLRVWQMEDNITKEKLFSHIKKTCNDTTSVEYKIQVEADFISQENDEIENIVDLNISSDRLIVVEYKSYNQRFCFWNSQVSITDHCENCRQFKVLSYICACKSVSYCSEACKQKDWYFHENRCTAPQIEEKPQQGPNSQMGITGLQNIGNTCFMNSGLQCLSNCFELTSYFLSELHQGHINQDAPLGTKGELTEQYANLVQQLWFGSKSVYTPKNFKKALSTHHKIFQGYNQHDSQEFLTELLSSMHEDLNLVREKKFIEIEDDAKAKHYWENFALRNNSIISVNFNGQFKSQLTCPDCNKVSITFDPYYMVSLPIPQTASQKSIKLFFLDVNNGNYYTQFDFQFDKSKNPSIKTLIPRILQKTGIKDEQLNFIVTSNYSFEREAAWSEDINDIRKKCKYRTLIARTLLDYEKNILEKAEPDSLMEICLIHKKKHQGYLQTMIPQIKYFMEKNMTFKELHIKIFEMFKYYFQDMINENESVESNIIRLLDIDEKGVLGENAIYKMEVLSKSVYMSGCPFCQERYCRGCPLNFTDDNNLNQLFETYEQSSYGKADIPPITIEWIKVDEKYTSEPNIFEIQRKIKQILIDQSQNSNSSNQIHQQLDQQQQSNAQAEGGAIASNNNNIEVEEQEEERKDNRNEDNAQKQNKQDVQNEEIEEEKQNENQGNNNEKLDLYQCLRHFSTPEKLDQFNEVYCRKCQEHKLMVKQMSIYSAPQILIFHFKRFYRKPDSALMKKIMTEINYPVDGLDMTGYVISRYEPGVFQEDDIEDTQNGDERLLYDLFGVSNHSGSLLGGHYTAFAKNPLNQKWYSFNDSSVSEVVNESQVVTDQAYVLFYRRRNSNISFKELQKTIYQKLYKDQTDLVDAIEYPIKMGQDLSSKQQQQPEKQDEVDND